MKTIVLIVAFIIGLFMGSSLMSIIAAQKIKELERNVAYFQGVYVTAQNELKNQSVINYNKGTENVTFNLEECEE